VTGPGAGRRVTGQYEESQQGNDTYHADKRNHDKIEYAIIQ
jgi:hypothetical protein